MFRSFNRPAEVSRPKVVPMSPTAQAVPVPLPTAQQFDYVVVDLPRSLVQWVVSVLERTDRLMLVTDCTVPSVRQARRLLDLYLENNPTLQVEVVMSQEHKPMIRGSHHIEAAKLLERPFRHWLPFDPRAARKAADRGAPLSAMGSSALSKAVASLGRDTLAALARPATAQGAARAR